MAKSERGGEPKASPAKSQATELASDERGRLAAIFNAGRYLELEGRARELLLQRPGDGQIWQVLGLSLWMQGKDALYALDRAAQLLPDNAEAHGNLGTALRARRRLADAVKCYRRALEIQPDFAEARNNLGCALRDLGQLDEAEAGYRRALEIQPHFAVFHYNLGDVLLALGRPDEAVASFRRALKLNPQLAEAHNMLAMALLLRGEFESGWPEYEWRLTAKGGSGTNEPRHFRQPRWLGGETLAGKTILVYSEQGLGDTLQFCRYLKHVAALGARVVFEVPKELAPLLSSLEGVAQIVVQGDVPPEFDTHCPLLSLPLAFKTTLQTIPASVPYIASNPEKVRYWRDKLGDSPKLRVGLVWSGGFRPNQPDVWAVNERRNIPLSKFSVLRHSNIDFYSLQKGQPAESELAKLIADGWSGPHIWDFTPQLKDFSDTAALIENLDLVISVDTSTAHLAAALGKRVWLLNRFDTCWRWLLRRTDSPWYPTVTLYRQARRGDWDGVIERVSTDLAQLLPISQRTGARLD